MQPIMQVFHAIEQFRGPSGSGRETVRNGPKMTPAQARFGVQAAVEKGLVHSATKTQNLITPFRLQKNKVCTQHRQRVLKLPCLKCQSSSGHSNSLRSDTYTGLLTPTSKALEGLDKGLTRMGLQSLQSLKPNYSYGLSLTQWPRTCTAPSLRPSFAFAWRRFNHDSYMINASTLRYSLFTLLRGFVLSGS